MTDGKKRRPGHPGDAKLRAAVAAADEARREALAIEVRRIMAADRTAALAAAGSRAARSAAGREVALRRKWQAARAKLRRASGLAAARAAVHANHAADAAALTAAEYAAAFRLWRGLSRGALPRPRFGADGGGPEAFDALVEGGCRAVEAAFPGPERRRPDAYCAAFDAFLCERPPEDAQWVGEFRREVRKSCLLDRLIYLREAPRDLPCPRHEGRWSGCHLGLAEAKCPHGCSAACGCTTGWVRSADLARPLPADLSAPLPPSPGRRGPVRPASAVTPDVVALSGAGFRVWSYPPHEAESPDAAPPWPRLARAGYDARHAVRLRYEGGHVLVACGVRVPGAPDLTEPGEEGP